MNRMCTRMPIHARRGSASLTAAFVLISLTALTVGLLQMGLAFTREHDNRRRDEKAIVLADVGIAEALLAMRAGETGRIGRRDTPARYGNGLLWTEVDDVGNQLRRVRSIGMVGSGRACIEVLIFHFANNGLTSPIFSNQSLKVGSQSFVDSWNSSLGSYASQLGAGSHVSSGSVIQSNGDVTLASSVEIYGDIHPGKDSSVTIPGSTILTGSTQQLAEDMTLTPVSAPSIVSMGALDVPADGLTTLSAGSYNYSSLDVGSGTFSIVGPATVVLGDLNLDSNTELLIDSSAGPVEIYISGSVDLASNSFIKTSTQSALDLALFLVGGPGQVADLRSNSEFYGRIYGPEATVKVNSNFEIFGGIAADHLILDANVKIHYDEALQTLVTDPETVSLASWTIVELPDHALVGDRSDPFALLGVNPAALPTPAAAHDLP